MRILEHRRPMDTRELMEGSPLRLSALNVVMLTVVALATSSVPPTATASPPSNHAVTPPNPPVNAYQNPQLVADPRSPDQLAMTFDNRDSSKVCDLALSTDGGAAWRIVALVGPGGRYPFAAGQDSCGGAQVQFTPAGGLVYGFNGVGSTDGKLHYTNYVMVAPSIDAAFSAPVDIDPKTEMGTDAGATNVYFDNTINIAVDPTTTAGSTRIYAAFDVLSYVQPTHSVYITVSSDGGRSFSTPAQIFTGSSFIPSPMGQVVDTNGNYYLAYINKHTPVYPASYSPVPSEIDLVTSTDHGQAFSQPKSVVTFTSPCWVDLLGGDQKQCPHHWPSLSMAAGRTAGRLYLAWALPTSIPKCVNLGTCDPDSPLARLWLSTSSDAGSNWSPPRAIGSPNKDTDNLILPTIDMAPNGRLDLAYYDLDAQGFEDTYLTSSSDAGASFAPAQRTSDVSSNTAIAPNPNYQCSNLGSSFGNRECDRLGLASTNSAAAVAWTDSRRGTKENGHNDIYFASMESAQTASTSPMSMTQVGATAESAKLPNSTGPRQRDRIALFALVAVIGVGVRARHLRVVAIRHRWTPPASGR